MSTEMPTPKNSSGCWKIGAIGCGVVAVLLVLAVVGTMYFAYSFMNKNPSFKEMTVCTQHMIAVNEALQRYAIRHNDYPSDLSQLVPTFLSDASKLHCPADKAGSSNISYQYIKPASNAADTDIVLICNRHVIAGNQFVLRMQKNGQMAKMNNPSSPLPPK